MHESAGSRHSLTSLGERRRHPRHRCELTVEMREVGGAGRVTRGSLKDLSEGGLCIITESALPRGRMLVVGAELGRDEPPFVARVLVRRCKRRPEGFEIGLSFTWLGGDQRHVLSSLRRFLDGVRDRAGPIH